MKISYNWLKDYLDFDYSSQELSTILTDTGLEVVGTSSWETIKGGLKGLTIGNVLTCEPHPDSDHLSITTVDLGDGGRTPIVCGAPNIAAGQKVVVATVGTTLYAGDKEFVIKKSKIRGQVSEGMICSEVEIGVGGDSDGIMVLNDNPRVGLNAAEYFNIEKDCIFDIDLTPNRSDGMSHLGVTRDIRAVMQLRNLGDKLKSDVEITLPSVEDFKSDNTLFTIKVKIDDDACQRYTGLTLSGLEIAESPKWLKDRLESIGLVPVNNVVDVTNFVMHETGQPLHAFDADVIADRKIIVTKLFEGTEFKTLDGVVRKLSENDLMINDVDKPLCMGGVLGGADSGVTDKTVNIFLESALFDPIHVRKSSKFHDIKTDASFRFERGTDPEMVLYALKRAAMLIKEVAGGKITSRIQDEGKYEYTPKRILLIWKHVDRLLGQTIPKKKIKVILKGLDIETVDENKNSVLLKIPPYRIDVTREADVIEEILRIYGYNNIENPSQIRTAMNPMPKPDTERIQNIVADFLSDSGFNEILNNSLTKAEYYENCKDFKAEQSVKMLNALSRDLNVMRQSMLFGGLESMLYNFNRKVVNQKLYEFGNVYNYFEENEVKYKERKQLAIWMSGKNKDETWYEEQNDLDFFSLKAYAENVLKRIGIDINKLTRDETSSSCFHYGMKYSSNQKQILRLGLVHPEVLDKFGIENEVYYAEIQWDRILKLIPKRAYEYLAPSKFPSVKRDLSLLIDETISFEEIQKVVLKSERKILKSVGLFDVYKGKNLPAGKKSYAISMTIEDVHKTLTDKQIDKLVNKVILNLKRELAVEIR